MRIALEQTDGSVFHFETQVLPESHPQASANVAYVERFVKFLLWARGGWRIYVDGPESLAAGLASHYSQTEAGRFDAHFVGELVFDHQLEVVRTRDLPPEHSVTKPLGGICTAAESGLTSAPVIGRWRQCETARRCLARRCLGTRVRKPDPQWHFDQIMDSLKRAAAHLPRVDAIGGQFRRSVCL